VSPLVRKSLHRHQRFTAHNLSFLDDAYHFIIPGQRPRCPASPEKGRLMTPVAKQATQDGTFTVYLGDRPVAWGLTSHAADALMERLLRH